MGPPPGATPVHVALGTHGRRQPGALRRAREEGVGESGREWEREWESKSRGRLTSSDSMRRSGEHLESTSDHSRSTRP